MKYRAIVVDWDGTLHDCIRYIVACFQTAANDINKYHSVK
jgi:phosphoglycolate phosphatase-like HAD superfamily hydrolase